MAVVMSGVASNGAKWRIHDDCYINNTPEKNEQLRRNACEIAHQALVKSVREKMAKQQKQKEQSDEQETAAKTCMEDRTIKP